MNFHLSGKGEWGNTFVDDTYPSVEKRAAKVGVTLGLRTFTHYFMRSLIKCNR